MLGYTDDQQHRDTVFLTDFGLAKSFLEPEPAAPSSSVPRCKHVAQTKQNALTGTMRFASCKQMQLFCATLFSRTVSLFEADALSCCVVSLSVLSSSSLPSRRHGGPGVHPVMAVERLPPLVPPEKTRHVCRVSSSSCSRQKAAVQQVRPECEQVVERQCGGSSAATSARASAV